MNNDNNTLKQNPDAVSDDISAVSSGLSAAQPFSQDASPDGSASSAWKQKSGVIQAKNWKTRELCFAAVQRYSWGLRYVPAEFRESEIYLAAVKKFCWMLRDVPAEFITPEICRAAVMEDSVALLFVPEEFSTAELILAALEADPYALGRVSVKLRTPELCHASVKREGTALRFVPKALRTPELCLVAVEQDGSALRDVPEALRTPELCLVAVEQDGWALQYVPEALRTPALCLVAVEQKAHALRDVPEELRTPALCLVAVKQNGDALQYVPDEFRTPELCLAAFETGEYARDIPTPLELIIHKVAQSGSALQHVPEKFRTPGVCAAAVQSNGRMLEHVPEKLMTSELCLAAVEQDGRALQFVPKAFRTAEVCLIAFRQNGYAFQFVSEELKTPELCQIAVEQSGYALQYVPEELKTPELCQIAVEQSGYALQYVPEELKTPGLCLVAVKQRGYALQYVPESFRTPELYLAAVQQDGLALRYVPEEFKTPKLHAAAFQQMGWKSGSSLSDDEKMSIFSNRAKMEKVEPADFDMATEAALEVYRLAALEKPPVILRMESPYAAMLGSALVILLLNRAKNRPKNHSGIPPTAEPDQSQVKERVMKKILKQNAEQAGKHVYRPEWYFGPWWYLFGIVRGSDPEALEIRWAEVLKQMKANTSGEFGDRLFECVMNQLILQTENLSKSQLLDYFGVYDPDFASYDSGDSSWLNWRSFVSFFQSAGEPNDEIFEHFDIDKTLAYSCGDVWWHENVLAISDRPKEIHKDADGQLHNDKGPSVLYRDGWGLYHWHGVPIPGEWVTGKPPSATEALTWENMEQRWAACEIIGWKNILSELDAVVIDEDDDPEIGTLFEADIPDSGKERFLQVRCGGTGREFVFPVPPHLETALEANAWRR